MFTTILTHPGGAHKDDFLACCLLLTHCPAPIERRDPTAEELGSPEIAVVDIGHRHEPDLGNFDHHQFPRDSTPSCSLSLVLQHHGLYEDARAFCDWLEPAEWLDCRGPVDTCRWLGIERQVLGQLNSPIDVTLLRRFSGSSRIEPGETLWQAMQWVGQDLVDCLGQLRQRLEFIAEHHQIWELQGAGGSFKVLFLPRTEPLPDDPSAGIGRFIESLGPDSGVIGLIAPDGRGSGYGLKRHQDDPRLEFTRIGDCEDVHFAHKRGFIAKSSATEPSRLRELMQIAAD